MILSVFRKFVFIKGVKVAGTSLEMALAGVCGDRDVITPLVPRDEAARCRVGRGCQNFGYSPQDEQAYRDEVLADYRAASFPLSMFYNHMPYAEVAAKTSLPLETCRYVVAERHPYAKLLSLVSYERHSRRYLRGETIVQDVARLRAMADLALHQRTALRVFNLPSYLSGAGRRPDVVIRYERLEEDYAAFLASLGVAAPPPLPHAKKSVMANTLDWKAIFNRRQLDAINTLFEAEFALYGYEML